MCLHIKKVPTQEVWLTRGLLSVQADGMVTTPELSQTECLSCQSSTQTTKTAPREPLHTPCIHSQMLSRRTLDGVSERQAFDIHSLPAIQRPRLIMNRLQSVPVWTLGKERGPLHHSSGIAGASLGHHPKYTSDAPFSILLSLLLAFRVKRGSVRLCEAMNAICTYYLIVRS